MAKGQKKSNREVRKPKQAADAKPAPISPMARTLPGMRTGK